ncbi:MAG: NADPH:quinone oxidoreductase family protein [Acidimicrobiales bacterium]
MRAVVCHQLGSVGDLAVEESPTPEPGPGQVRVAVEAAGASYVDGLRVAGRYQFPMQPPYTPGGEAAGVIDAVGDGVADWAVGDRVLAVVAAGGFADAVLAKPRQLFRLPDGVDMAVGASFYQVYGTAWFALKHRTTVRPGETMLVTGAGGGVGLAAIDVARSLGARVIAIASSPEKRALAMSAGAEATIDPTTEDVKNRARELTDGQGVDLVYDVVGGELSEQCLRAMRFDGRFVIIGFTAGIGRVPLNLVLLNNRTVVGVEWGGWVQRNPDANRALMDDVLDAIARGELHPVTPTVRPLEEAPAVLADLLERRAVGKIVLRTR